MAEMVGRVLSTAATSCAMSDSMRLDLRDGQGCTDLKAADFERLASLQCQVGMGCQRPGPVCKPGSLSPCPAADRASRSSMLSAYLGLQILGDNVLISMHSAT